METTQNEIIEKISLAIQTKKTIRIWYQKLIEKEPTLRIINPHNLYEHATTDNLIFDGVQLNKVDNSYDWKQFVVNRITKIRITPDNFTIAKGYNGTSKRYTLSRVAIEI